MKFARYAAVLYTIAVLVTPSTASAASEVPDGTYCDDAAQLTPDYGAGRPATTGRACITVSATSTVTPGRNNITDQFGRLGNWTIVNCGFPGVFHPDTCATAHAAESTATISTRVRTDGTVDPVRISVYSVIAPDRLAEMYCRNFNNRPRHVGNVASPPHVGRVDSSDAAMQLCGFTQRDPDGGNYALVDPFAERSCTNPEKAWLVNPELPLSATNPLREESAIVNRCVSTQRPATATVAKCTAVKYGRKTVAVTSTGVGCVGARNMMAKYLRVGVEPKGWDCTERRVGKARVATCVSGAKRVVGRW